MVPDEASPLVVSGRRGRRSRKDDDDRNRTTTFFSGPVSTKKVAFLLFPALIMTLYLSKIHIHGRFPSNQQGFDRRFWDEEFMKDWEAHLIRSSSSSHHTKNSSARLSISQQKAKQDVPIYLNHTAAFLMLNSHGKSTSRDFFFYQQGWEHQITQSYCAVASSAAVMNSFRGYISLPQDQSYIPYSWATQMDLMVNECVRNSIAKPLEGHQYPSLFAGIGLDMTRQLLECHVGNQGFTIDSHHIDSKTVAVNEIRDLLVNALRDKDARVIINFDRSAMDQEGHGHFSPLGAYHDETDSFLIMDVAKYKYPPVWISATRLLAGVGSVDNCAVIHYPNYPVDDNLSMEELARTLGCQPANRGFLIVRKIT